MAGMQTVSIIGLNDSPPSWTVAETPEGHKDVRINVVNPFLAVGVRFLNVFVMTFMGLLTGDSAASALAGVDLLPVPEGASPVVRYALLSLSAAAWEGGKSLVTIFKRLEEKFPLVTGSI